MHDDENWSAKERIHIINKKDETNEEKKWQRRSRQPDENLKRKKKLRIQEREHTTVNFWKKLMCFSLVFPLYWINYSATSTSMRRIVTRYTVYVHLYSKICLKSPFDTLFKNKKAGK